ncbi:MAG: RagB/SusD family nutrient uptake outer membrane protein, partial [Muribaculaceae bacterium]|nr:RagB/SusD family nutrient uptake outer membrane protein [Muribaculaceae bacterium]
YLMAAESVVRGGTGLSRSEALNLVNKVRERAYGDMSGNISDSEMDLQFFIDERARELLHESVRRTDLRRFGMFTTDKYIWQWKGGVVDGKAVDSKYEIYPIPATELSVNTNLSNPNY